MEAVNPTPGLPITQETEAFFKNHIEQQEAGGLSKRRYCEINGLSYHRFNYWAKKLKKSTALISNPSSFISIKLKNRDPDFSSTGALSTLSFTNGCFLQVHSLDALSLILEKMN